MWLYSKSSNYLLKDDLFSESGLKRMREIRAVILAGGTSTRMKSETTKMVHELQFKPMVKYVMEACGAAGIEIIYVIVGHDAELVRQVLGSDCHYVFVITQKPGSPYPRRTLPCQFMTLLESWFSLSRSF